MKLRKSAPLLASLLWACCLSLSHSHPLDFELAGEQGFVQLSSLPAQATLINFWRSDCPPCVREMPLFAQLAREGKLRVVAVAVQRPSETMTAPQVVQHALQAPLHSLHAPSDSRGLLARFGNRTGALPHTVLLNSAREVCSMKTGEIDLKWIREAAARCAAPQSWPTHESIE